MVKIVWVNNPINVINEHLENIKNYLEVSGYVGEINFDLTESAVDESFYGKWIRYYTKSAINKPEIYMSEWSPNNGSDVGALMKTNPFFEALINRYYDNSAKYEEVNMIGEFYMLFEDMEYYIENFGTKYHSEENSKFIEYILSEDFEMISLMKDFETLPECSLKDDIKATVEMFYGKNPKFKFNW